jgi:hypothetical protein
MVTILIAEIVQSATKDAVNNLPYHTVGETVGGFLFAAVKHFFGHIWALIIVPLRSEATAIGNLLMRFSIMRYMQRKIEACTTVVKAKFHKEKKENGKDASA